MISIRKLLLQSSLEAASLALLAGLFGAVMLVSAPDTTGKFVAVMVILISGAHASNAVSRFQLYRAIKKAMDKKP